jgi:hypothetical protein
MKIFQQANFIKIISLVVLALVFAAYLKPEMMVGIANTVLTLCGW